MRQKKMKKIIFLMVLATFQFSNSVGAVELEKVERLQISSARFSSLGGLHAALADSVATLFSNPAGFQSVERGLHISEITLQLSGPIFDIAGLVIEGIQEGDVNALLSGSGFQSLLTGLYSSMRLTGPISFGYMGGGLGFGLYNWADLIVKTVSPLTVNMILRENILITAGYSFRIPIEKANSNLDIGIMLKSFMQGEIDATHTLLELASLMSNPTALVFNEPFKFQVGVGVDLGVIFSYKDILSFGLVGRDVATFTMESEYSSLLDFVGTEETPTTTNGIVPLDLSVGILFSPVLGSGLKRVLSDLRILFDYNDILDFIFNPAGAKLWALHFGLGIEIGMLEILFIRGGFHDGLFSAGLGLDLTFFQLDISMFGTEISSQPGMRPVYNLIFGVNFDL